MKSRKDTDFLEIRLSGLAHGDDRVAMEEFCRQVGQVSSIPLAGNVSLLMTEKVWHPRYGSFPIFELHETRNPSP